MNKRYLKYKKSLKKEKRGINQPGVDCWMAKSRSDKKD